MPENASETLSRDLVPSRELNLLLEGLKGWVVGLTAQGRRSKHYGIISGEPGQSQSLLVRVLCEFAQRVGVRVLGGAFHARIRVPGGAFADVVRSLLEDAKRGDPVVASVTSRFADDLEKLCPPASAPSGGASRPSLGREHDRLRLIDSIVCCILALAREAPTILVLEDVDNADELGRELVQHLRRVLERQPSKRRPRLLVVLTRSEAPAQVSTKIRPAALLPAIGSDLVAFAIAAQGYSRDDVRRCARLAGKDLSPEECDAIVRDSGGNAGRALRLLGWPLAAESGAGGVESRRETPRAKAPRERLETLSPEARQVLLVLATAGFPLGSALLVDLARRIQDGWLPAASSGGGDGLAVLAELERLGWIRFTSHSSLPSSRRARLEDGLRDEILGVESRDRQHEVARALAAALVAAGGPGPFGVEVVQRFLLPDFHDGRVGRRRRPRDGFEPAVGAGLDAFLDLCTRAAEYLEALGALEPAIETWEGYLRLLPGDRGPDRLRAETRMLGLLEEAEHTPEAVQLCEKLLQRESSGDVAIDLWLRLSNLHARLDRKTERTAAFDRARALAGQGASALRFSVRQARHALDDGNALAAAGLCASALSEQGSGAGPAELEELLEIAQAAAYATGDYRAALVFERRLLDARESSGDLRGVTRSCTHIARLCSLLGDAEAAAAALERCQESAKATGSRLLTARVLARVAEREAERGQLPSAQRLFLKARRTFLQFGTPDDLIFAESHLAELELRQGRFRTGARMLESAISRRFGVDMPGCAGSPLAADDAAAEEREIAAARRDRAAAAQELLRRRGGPGAALTTEELIELGRWTLDTGSTTDARRLLEEALQREEARQQAELGARILRDLGRIAIVEGRWDEAIETYEQCLKRLTASPDRRVLSSAYVDLGKLLLGRGHIAKSFDYTIRGLTIALDSGAEREVLDAVLGVTDFLASLGQARAALRAGLAAMELAKSVRDRATELQACRLSARAARFAGETLLSDRLLTRAAFLEPQLALRQESCLVRLEQGWGAGSRGDFPRALQLARESVEIARGAGYRVILGDLLLLVGAIAGAPENARRSFLRALEALEQALESAEERVQPALQWQAYRTLERTYRGRGKPEVARDHAVRASEIEEQFLRPLPAELGALRWQCRQMQQVLPTERRRTQLTALESAGFES